MNGYRTVPFILAAAFLLVVSYQQLAPAAPVITVLGPPEGATSTENAAVLSVNVADENGITDVIIDGQGYTVSGPTTLDLDKKVNLKPGPNSILISAINKKGELAEKQLHITYDVPPGTAALVAAAPANPPATDSGAPPQSALVASLPETKSATPTAAAPASPATATQKTPPPAPAAQASAPPATAAPVPVQASVPPPATTTIPAQASAPPPATAPAAVPIPAPPAAPAATPAVIPTPTPAAPAPAQAAAPAPVPPLATTTVPVKASAPPSATTTIPAQASAPPPAAAPVPTAPPPPAAPPAQQAQNPPAAAQPAAARRNTPAEPQPLIAPELNMTEEVAASPPYVPAASQPPIRQEAPPQAAPPVANQRQQPAPPYAPPAKKPAPERFVPDAAEKPYVSPDNQPAAGTPPPSLLVSELPSPAPEPPPIYAPREDRFNSPVLRTPPPPAAAQPAPGPALFTGDCYIVVAKSFLYEDNARAAATGLLKKGYGTTIFVETIGKTTAYYLILGFYRTRDQAAVVADNFAVPAFSPEPRKIYCENVIFPDTPLIAPPQQSRQQPDEDELLMRDDSVPVYKKQ